MSGNVVSYQMLLLISLASGFINKRSRHFEPIFFAMRQRL
jgi:hypothetical protein